MGEVAYMSEYKTAQELGLPWPPRGECDTCGFSLMPHSAKCYGVAELIECSGVFPDGFVSVCSTCFTVMVTMNKDYLYRGSYTGEKPMGGPYKRMYLVDRSGLRVAIWEVIGHKPWLKQTQVLPPKGESDV